ncbi:MAG: tRNA lysidine(34) synthetase TilS [Acutalibacteraceae bacterium]|jgi:tRNA(Ile)-lysidine synthase
MTVVEQVRQTMAQYHMLSPGETVVVGLSGGADSVALLSLLLEIGRQTGTPGRIVAAHLNHRLRGEESDADETFVRSFCAEQGVELRVRWQDVAALAASAGKGVEETGRQCRYAFFEELAREFAPAKIATAHHRDDNAETVLLHLTRGSGPRGLGGIPPMRDNVIRPLIEVSRARIEAYCARRGLTYRRDSTNDDPSYGRNRIRLQVLPALRRINPAADEALARLARIARQDEAYFEEQAAALILAARSPNEGYDAAVLAAAPPSIRLRALRQIAFGAAGTDMEARHLDGLDALLAADGALTLPGGVRAARYRGRLYCPVPPTPTFSPFVPEWDGRVYEICGKNYAFHRLSLAQWEKRRRVHKILSKNALDCDMITNSTVVRPRRTGDRFAPPGRPAKTVKKWLNETGVPPWLREATPLLCDGDGVLWIAGLGVSAGAAVTGSTRQVLWIEDVEKERDDA